MRRAVERGTSGSIDREEEHAKDVAFRTNAHAWRATKESNFLPVSSRDTRVCTAGTDARSRRGARGLERESPIVDRASVRRAVGLARIPNS